MTREEAIKHITAWMYATSDLPPKQVAEALDFALTDLRGPTREMVEKMFPGCADCQRKTCVSCRRFGRVPERCIDCNNQDKWRPWNFCPVCGKPMSDEAVDMMVRRWKEAVEDGKD